MQLEKLANAAKDYLKREGVEHVEVYPAYDGQPQKMEAAGYQVKLEPLEDPRGTARKVRVHVFNKPTHRDLKAGVRTVRATGKTVAEAILEIIPSIAKEQKLREAIRQIISEASVDRGFLNGFAEALEDLTGREAYVKSSEEDAIRYDGRSNELDIYLRGGGAVGGRLGGEIEIQVIDRTGRVRTGIDVPPDPEVAAEELAREFDKINESNLRSKIRSLIREEADDEEVIQGEEHDDEEDAEERVGVENAESGNRYKVRRSFAFENPQRYNKIREVVRKNIRRVVSESGQMDMFGGATRQMKPSEALRQADSFEIHDKEPMDFGKHFEARDVAEIVDFLQRSGTPEDYEVAMFDGRNPLTTIPARQFLRLVQNTTL